MVEVAPGWHEVEGIKHKGIGGRSSAFGKSCFDTSHIDFRSGRGAPSAWGPWEFGLNPSRLKRG
jgi:hypothetical protein